MNGDGCIDLSGLLKVDASYGSEGALICEYTILIFETLIDVCTCIKTKMQIFRLSH